MDRTSELASILGQELKWNKARLDCFSRMLLSLLLVRSVNLKKLAVAFPGKAQRESRYQRLKRFFRGFEMDYCLIARMIFKWFSFRGQSVYLTLDRTNWFLGKAKINVFMLGIAYEGVAIPLLWKLLPKAGNASAKEHIALVQRFVHLFGQEGIQGILGDREFASGRFFKWLNQKRIPFYIRIKDNSQTKIQNKKLFTAKKLFNYLNCKQQGYYGMSVHLWKGDKVFLAGSRSERGELMIVATNQSPKNAIAIYLRRWEIECLFQTLKGRGFHFEETHLTDLKRLEKLIALLAIAFCWAHSIGEWRALKRPIPLNQYQHSQRPQYTLFRYGLDWLQELLFHPQSRRAEWKISLFFFCKTPLLPSMRPIL